MAQYKVIFEDEEQDEIFDSEEAAEEYALYLCSCSREGAEILHMSNPGDYDYDEDEEYDYEIIEIDQFYSVPSWESGKEGQGGSEWYHKKTE